MFIKRRLSELMASGRLNDGVGQDGSHQMSIKEAIADGFLTPESMVKIDEKTGKVSLVNETVLMTTKSSLDGVVKIETSLVEQPPPTDQVPQVHKKKIKKKKAPDDEDEWVPGQTPGHATKLWLRSRKK